MKSKSLIWCTIILVCFCFAQCKKSSSSQEDKLPPATQTGANTFGCLINGKVYIPKGYDGTGTPNPHVIYDIGLNGLPYLQIDALQFFNNSSISEGEALIIISNITSVGSYYHPNNFNFSIGSAQYLNNCGTPAFDTTIKEWGVGVITKYDITNHIISGTFNFKYKTLTCDTVFITDGRYDIKF